MTSLNLLPPERKIDLRTRQEVRRWRRAVVLSLLGCVVSIMGVVVMEMTLAQQLATSEKSLQTWKDLSAKRESGQVQAVTTHLNQSIAGLQALFSPLSLQRTALGSFFSIIPKEVTITSATFAPDGSFTLAGVAATRASFLALRTALEQSPTISASTTTSTASQRENLPFEYTGKLVVTP